MAIRVGFAGVVLGGVVFLIAIAALILGTISISRQQQQQQTAQSPAIAKVAAVAAAADLTLQACNLTTCTASLKNAYAAYQAVACPENVPVVRTREWREQGAKNVILMADFPNMADMEVKYLLHKSPRANFVYDYLTGDAWGNVGVAFANSFKIHHLFDKSLVIPVVGGSLASLNDSATGHLDYLQSVTRGKGGLVDSDNMWSTAHMLAQGTRHYEFLSDLVADEPENPDAFIPPAVSAMALKRFILSASAGAGKRFVLLSVGPMTPIVHLFENCTTAEKAAVAKRIEKVVIMGGSIDAPGNVFSRPPFAGDSFCNPNDPYYTAHGAEFNMYNDPHAAKSALQTLVDLKIEVTLVPLDATDDVPYSDALISHLTGSTMSGSPAAPGPQTPEAQIVGQAQRNFQKSWFTTGADEHCFFDGQTNPSCCFFNARGGASFIWDSTALLVALYPELVVLNQSRTSIYVESDNSYFDFSTPGQGSTNRCDPMLRSDCVTVNVVYDVNKLAIYSLMEQLLQSPVNSATRQLYCPLP